MITALGLRREKLAATFDKRQLAQSIAMAVGSLCAATKTSRKDFWINVELTVHMRGGTMFDKHARISAYIASHVRDLVKDRAGNCVPPEPAFRTWIKATFDEADIARGMACVVKALATSVLAEQDDFYARVDLDVHIVWGKACEKKARLNVYGDLIDPCDTTITEPVDWNKVPSEIFAAFCEDLDAAQE